MGMTPSHPSVVALFLTLALAWVIAFGCIALDLSTALRRWLKGDLDRAARASFAGLAALWTAGTLLRLALATWGPGDDQFRHREVFNEGRGWFPYNLDLGSTPAVLWKLLFFVLPETDTTILAVTMLAGSLIPVVVFALMRELGAGRMAAFSGAVLACIQPFLVRTSGEASRVSLVCLLGLGTFWALARYAREGRVRHVVAAVAIGLLCCRARPEAGAVVILAGILCVTVLPGLAAERRVRRVLTSLIAVGVIGGFGVFGLWFSSQYEPSIGRHMTELRSHSLAIAFVAPWSVPAYAPVAMTGLALVGGLRSLLRGPPAEERRMAAWALLSVIVLSVILPQHFTSIPFLAYARYHALTFGLVMVLGGIGSAVVIRATSSWVEPRRQWVVAAVLLGGVAISAIPPLRFVSAPRVMDLEYRFLRRTLQELPADAIIYRPYDRDTHFVGGYRDPGLLSEIVGGGEWRMWPPVGPPDRGRAEYVYEPPSCARSTTWASTEYPDLEDLKARCRAARAAVGAASPVATAEFPARAFCGDLFVDETVTASFFVLQRRE